MRAETRDDEVPVTSVAIGGGRPDVLLAVRPADAALPVVLSPGERRRQRDMAPARAAEFARGRTLLRRLAGLALGLPPHRVPLRRRPGGAPHLRGLRAGVSLSHSRRWTAAAYWPGGPVGVDVEEPPRRLDAALVRRCCGARAELLERLPADARAALFARVWTVQEACVKVTGAGLAGAPWRIPVDPFAAGGRWRDIGWHALDDVSPAGLAVAVGRTPEEDR